MAFDIRQYIKAKTIDPADTTPCPKPNKGSDSKLGFLLHSYRVRENLRSNKLSFFVFPAALRLLSVFVWTVAT